MKEFYNRQINYSTQSKTSWRQTQLKWKAGGNRRQRERETEIKTVEWSDKTMELINAATLLPVRYLDTSRRNAIDMCIHIVIIIIIMGFCIYSETKSLSLSLSCVVAPGVRWVCELSKCLQVFASLFPFSLYPSLSFIDLASPAFGFSWRWRATTWNDA